MRRFFALIVMAALVSLALAADQPETLELLKERADKATEGHQADLCVKVAERQLQAMDAAYNEGNIEKAQAALKDVVEYSLRAAKVAAESGKRMKQTDLALRKIAERLSDIQRTLSVDDRPPVKDAVEKLQKARDELLARMFKK